MSEIVSRKCETTERTLNRRRFVIFSRRSRLQLYCIQGVPKKPDPLDYFDDNFGKYGLILTIFLLLQRENYGTQNLGHFSHLTFIMLPLCLAKQTLMLVSMSLLRHYCVCV